jgi:MoxR-like ATPase
MARVSMGYPVETAELAMLDNRATTNPLDELTAVSDAETVRRLVRTVAGVHVSPAVQKYVVAIASATRQSPDLALGASPRASLHLVRAARAWAALEGRDYVVPDDVDLLTVPVLAHRLLPTVESAMGGRSVERTLRTLVGAVPAPSAVGR